jgi:hypothetical protein
MVVDLVLVHIMDIHLTTEHQETVVVVVDQVDIVMVVQEPEELVIKVITVAVAVDNIILEVVEEWVVLGQAQQVNQMEVLVN